MLPSSKVASARRLDSWIRANINPLLLIFTILLVTVGQTVRAQDRRPDSIDDMKSVLKELRLLTKPNLKVLAAANDSIRAKCRTDSVVRIQTSLAALQGILDEETKLTATASFSLTDNLASGRSTDSTKTRSGTQQVKAEFSVSRGVYPLDFNLDASVSLDKKKDGTVQEDVSRLFLSVDRNLRSTTLEVFGFLSRTKDDYLGIKDRYETGAGFTSLPLLERGGRFRTFRSLRSTAGFVRTARRWDSWLFRDSGL